jgi:2-polyprenyl-3-methyl-5-hydroxy-6-metoxy-1,4-benzoquinol methylase
MDTHPMTQMNSQAQEFWLEQLGSTPAINDWYFSKFRNYLGAKILEIGCGVGTFSRLMGETGAEVLGLDISSDFVNVARQATSDIDQVKIELADVTTGNWNMEFDTVVALDVIEHIEDDTAMLESLFQALQPGGTAIIKVPAMQAIYGTLDEVVGHHRRYSANSITHVMSGAGFEGIQVKYFNVFGILGWWLNGSLLRRQTPPAGQVEMFERLLPVIRAVDYISPNYLGLSLVAIAQRP